MNVKIEIVEGLAQEEIIIRCGRLDNRIVSLQNYISEQSNGKRCLALFHGETDYYVPMEEVYFFETEGREVQAHTADKVFVCRYKLYELEDLLPGRFMRISKSSIVNLEKVYSVTRNLAASSVVEFIGSGKRVLVSRGYYRAFTERLCERKLGGSKRRDAGHPVTADSAEL